MTTTPTLNTPSYPKTHLEPKPITSILRNALVELGGDAIFTGTMSSGHCYTLVIPATTPFENLKYALRLSPVQYFSVKHNAKLNRLYVSILYIHAQSF